MALSAGSLREFFDFQPGIAPRHVAAHCTLTSARIAGLRRRFTKPTPHDVAQLAIAFGEPYDAVLNELDALDGKHIALLRRQLAAQETIPQDTNV